MKYAVVSTYPREGSQNIGDKLIERATTAALRTADPSAEITTIWRAQPWKTVRNTVSGADHVVFACLAIRAKMDAIYPYLEETLDLGVPVSAISAGTSLSPSATDIFGQGFSAADIALLRRFAGAARVFTTRGALTQAFCERHELAGAIMSGDVAFLDPRFDDRRFVRRDTIRRIVISDPHHGPVYVPAFRKLVEVLGRHFSDASIDCVLHGVNPPIENAAAELGLTVRPIYLSPEDGLEVYDEYDLHAGFRVHGHVSALQRRIPSYLLEQDGRGADYGLTLQRKISVPCYRTTNPDPEKASRTTLGLVMAALTTPRPQPEQKIAKHFAVSHASAELLGALIAKDAAEGFTSFLSFERTIAEFNRRTGAAIRRICRPGD